MATETTPLQQPVDQFNQLLQEEDKDQSLLSLLTQRPFAATLAFALFCLLVLVCQIFSQSLAYDWSSVPQITVNWASLEPSHTDQSLLLTLDARMDLNSPFGVGSSLVNSISAFIGSVDVSFEQTQVLYSGQHLVFVDIPHTHTINTSIPTDLEFEIKVHDIGHKSTLQGLFNTIIEGNSTEFTVKGAIVVSKMGISWRVPFTRSVSGSIGDDDVENVGFIDKISVKQTSKGLMVDVLSTFFSPTKSHISLTIPPTDWKVKMEDCKGTLHQICEGHMDSLSVDLDQDNNVTASAMVEHLPGSMIGLCGDSNKSPLDIMVSKYLSGEQTDLFVQGSCEIEDSFLGRALDGINVRVPVSGKPVDDKIVESVQVHQVTMGLGGDFNGEAAVSVNLPRIFNIDPDAVVGAQNIRGEIVLSHNEVDFGKIILEDWNPCVTTKEPQGYLVQVYFNRVPFEVLDTREAAMVSRYLMFVGSVPVGYRAILDIDVITPVAHFFISDFDISGKTILEHT